MVSRPRSAVFAALSAGEIERERGDREGEKDRARQWKRGKRMEGKNKRYISARDTRRVRTYTRTHTLVCGEAW